MLSFQHAIFYDPRKKKDQETSELSDMLKLFFLAVSTHEEGDSINTSSLGIKEKKEVQDELETSFKDIG